jgi:hypothetical protein
MMEWIKTTDRLPKCDDSGWSDEILIYIKSLILYAVCAIRKETMYSWMSLILFCD